MDNKDLIVAGTTKKVYAAKQSDQVILEFLDTLPDDTSKKKTTISGKGVINNTVSAFLFEYLESYNVPTHFIKKLDDKSFLAQKLDIIPMIFVVHNVASQELAERLGMEEGTILDFPVVEMYYKDEKRSYPMINEYHAYALGLCDRKEMTNISRIATKVNAVLKSFFDRKKMKLVRVQMEFGRTPNQIILVDEVSLDTLTLWALNEEGELEKPPATKKKDISFYKLLQAHILGSEA